MKLLDFSMRETKWFN